jgi:hypothetical protein
MAEKPKHAGRATRQPGFSGPAVQAAFEQYPRALKARLMALRQMIFDTAAGIDGVGPLEETLKWGQPSYLTTQTKAGSTIRLDRIKATEGQYALYFHCQTDLVDTFRSLYPTHMKYDGNRSIVFDANDDLPETELRHCLGLALTFHLRKRTTGLKRRAQ